MDDINEPLDMYQNHLRDTFEQNCSEIFETFVAQSGCNEVQNAEIVKKINILNNEIIQNKSKKRTQECIRIFSWIVFIFGLGINIIFLCHCVDPSIEIIKITPQVTIWGLFSAVIACCYIFFYLNRKIRTLTDYINETQSILNEHFSQAWNQLAPLNRLYQWDTIANLIVKTIPAFSLDKYFSNARLDELVNHFGMGDVSTQKNSILNCQSGAINGNPFVICTSKDFHMGQKKYEGSLHITWQEREDYTDSQGKSNTRWVTKSQTLYATVTKPFPEYNESRFLIYGNEAAPDLEFSRSPSSLSNMESMFFSLKQWMAIRKLRKKSQKLQGFMAMNNTEFDTVFGAMNRNHEVQFRLLFTPLAQREMLKILRDQNVGYGDDFVFQKKNRINIVYPTHFKNIDISCNPKLFQNYDLAAARKFFKNYCTEYFKSFFFAFAPILAIPLYQQPRPNLNVSQDVSVAKSSSWECEAIANDFGQEVFKHSNSVTENILKVHQEEEKVMVTAYGFRGVSRTDYVSVRGNDGYSHKVPVSWVEYLPVKRTSSMIVKETGGMNQLEFEEEYSKTQKWQDFFQSYKISLGDIKYHKSLIAFLYGN